MPCLTSLLEMFKTYLICLLAKMKCHVILVTKYYFNNFLKMWSCIFNLFMFFTQMFSVLRPKDGFKLLKHYKVCVTNNMAMHSPGAKQY